MPASIPNKFKSVEEQQHVCDTLCNVWPIVWTSMPLWVLVVLDCTCLLPCHAEDDSQRVSCVFLKGLNIGCHSYPSCRF